MRCRNETEMKRKLKYFCFILHDDKKDWCHIIDAYSKKEAFEKAKEFWPDKWHLAKWRMATKEEARDFEEALE